MYHTTSTPRRWVALCMIASASIALWACSDPPSSSTSPVPSTTESQAQQSFHIDQISEKARERIRTDQATEQLTPYSVTAPGHVALDLAHVAKVSSRISGQIDAIMINLGQRVRKNQPLAAIESLQLDGLVQEYLVAKAKRDVTATNLARTRRLLANNIVAKRRVLEDQGQHIETQAVFQHVREKLLNMGLSDQELYNLEHGSHLEGHKYILRAPLDGTIVQQWVVLGQGMTAGEALFEIVDTSRVWVFANLPIEQARRFKEGDQGEVIPRGGAPITAKLTYIAPVAEESTRTIRFRFDVDNAKGQLKPNEYVDVRLVDQQHPVLAIPSSAVTMVNGTRGVFVQRETGYDFVVADLGQESGGLIEVKQGISQGDRVVTSGVFDLKNALLKSTIAGEES